MILYGPRIVTVIGQLKATAPQQVVTVNLCRRRRVTQSDGDIHRIEKSAAMPPIWVSEDPKKKPDADGLAVCTENSNSDIMVMQSAKDRVGMDTSSSLNWARERRVLI